MIANAPAVLVDLIHRLILVHPFQVFKREAFFLGCYEDSSFIPSANLRILHVLSSIMPALAGYLEVMYVLANRHNVEKSVIVGSSSTFGWMVLILLLTCGSHIV